MRDSYKLTEKRWKLCTGDRSCGKKAAQSLLSSFLRHLRLLHWTQLHYRWWDRATITDHALPTAQSKLNLKVEENKLQENCANEAHGRWISDQKSCNPHVATSSAGSHIWRRLIRTWLWWSIKEIRIKWLRYTSSTQGKLAIVFYANQQDSGNDSAQRRSHFDSDPQSGIFAQRWWLSALQGASHCPLNAQNRLFQIKRKRDKK